MSTSRRELFRFGAAVAASCCFPQAVAAASRKGDGNAAAARRAFFSDDPLLTRSLLTGQLQTSFGVEAARADSRRLALTLVEVADLPSAPVAGTAGSELCFSAIFSGPAAAPLAQRTYRLNHRLLGAFSVFLVPVGLPASTRHYEAVFNRPEA